MISINRKRNPLVSLYVQPNYTTTMSKIEEKSSDTPPLVLTFSKIILQIEKAQLYHCQGYMATLCNLYIVIN